MLHPFPPRSSSRKTSSPSWVTLIEHEECVWLPDVVEVIWLDTEHPLTPLDDVEICCDSCSEADVDDHDEDSDTTVHADTEEVVLVMADSGSDATAA